MSEFKAITQTQEEFEMRLKERLDKRQKEMY